MGCCSACPDICRRVTGSEAHPAPQRRGRAVQRGKPRSKSGSWESSDVSRTDTTIARIFRPMVVFSRTVTNATLGRGAPASSRCLRLGRRLQPDTHRPALRLLDLEGLGPAHEVAQLAEAERAGVEV